MAALKAPQELVEQGEVLAGKYRVDRILGAGGMGVVVAATHLELDQLVALKFLLPEFLQNAEAVQRFMREARAAVRIRSEHVARILDVGLAPQVLALMLLLGGVSCSSTPSVTKNGTGGNAGTPGHAGHGGQTVDQSGESSAGGGGCGGCGGWPVSQAGAGGALGYGDELDSTRFFTSSAPTFIGAPTRWTAANEAVRVSLEYDEDRRGLFLVELEDVASELSYLEEEAALLQLVDPDGATLLDLSEGWSLVDAPSDLGRRTTRHGEPAWDLSVRLRSSEQPLSSTPIEVELRFTIFAGNEPYLLVEPFLFGDLKLGTHVAVVRYARMPLPLVQQVEPFGQYSSHHVLAAENLGLWVSAGNYNTEVAAIGEHDVRVQARANVYLDQYLPLTDGSLGAWIIGTYHGGSDAARYDYQLFLLKHWIAGSHSTIAPHVHDYWYSTRGGVSSSQPERLAALAPLVKESGFHFFWFIYDNHGVWPDWGPTPAEYFPGGVDVDNPASITAVMAEHGIPVGLYTAPNREVYDQQHHLQQPLCEDYGELLGEMTNISGAPIWWYEDHPGERYEFTEGTGNQPPGDASWMWRQGYMTTRRALRQAAPGTSICRTWVDSVEQLGWAEACSALDVWGSGANQSGGSTKASDYSLTGLAPQPNCRM